MFDDPRLKRVLKRYEKGSNLSDASIDVSNLGVGELLKACRCASLADLSAPKELDETALAHLSKRMDIPYNIEQFDYFLHSYIRAEHVEAYYADPSVTSMPAPENGPPSKIPLSPGTAWRSVRPKNGQESYEAWPLAN